MTKSITEREWLATRVMRYTRQKYSPIHNYCHYKTPEGELIYNDDWNPRENIKQAEMLLEAYQDYHIVKEVWQYTVYIPLNDMNEYEGESNTSLSNAIVEAVLQASGWEGNK